MHKAGKWLTGLLLFVMATAGYAAPTAIAERPAAAVCTSRPSDYADAPVAAASVTEVGEAYNCHLANIADELLKPPGDSIDSPAPAVAATSLPAVPSALFMGLTGFLCVSLVRDRKVWMAALAGLLWAGQAGVTVLPQVAHHLAGRRHATQCFSPNVAYVPTLDHSDRPRSDIEGTRYVCLLRYLAGIPAADKSVQPSEPKRTAYSVQRVANPKRYTLHAKRYRLNGQRTTNYEQPTTNIVAINGVFSYLIEATKRLAYITKQHACFSPAFTFENLPRGPPCHSQGDCFVQL